MSVDFCDIELEHPIINGSGTFDAIAAQRAFGEELLQQFPFAAFVSKTVTVEPRQGNPPPRLWELPGGMMNSIGLPNKGLERFIATDLPVLAWLPLGQSITEARATIAPRGKPLAIPLARHMISPSTFQCSHACRCP